MAVTLFHRIINRVKIINKYSKKEPQQKAVKVSADIKTIKHTITEVRS